MADFRLLLIEDDEDDYIITRDLLADIGLQNFVLDWFDDIDAARAAFARNEHDLCLLDYTLGRIDGISLLKEAAQLGFAGPVIMLTGQDNAQLDAEAMSAGAVDYLVKSQLTASRLARAIRYAISRREMETARLQRLKAESENRAKSEFLARLSHELRTPLTAILGYTDILLSKPESDDRPKYLHIIKNNGAHLLGLLNDVLDLSKIEAGKLDIEASKFNLHELLSDLYHLMTGKAQDKQLKLQFSSRMGLPRQIIQDPVRLRQILLNLLGNALKYTDAGEVGLTAEYQCRDGRHWLHIEVSDTGSGIASDELEEVFLPFAQCHNTADWPDKGTGLGLAISRQLASVMQGCIEVTSEVGKGSTFTLQVPFRVQEAIDLVALDISVKAVTNHLLNPVRLQGRVLVVDDIDDIRHLVGHIIGSTGLSVSYAADGLQALEALLLANREQRPFDLAILDLQMPGLSGMEVLGKMRQLSISTTAIALTAATMKGQREACLRAGFAAHLAKPVDERLLIRVLRKFLRTTTPPGQKHDSARVLSPVLLIEDDRDAREATRALLQLLQCEVSTAASGAEAMEHLHSQHPPKLVISDIQLPDVSGQTLSLQLRERLGDRVRLVALTGHSLKQDESGQHAFDDVFLKPVSLDTLKAIVGKAEN